MTRIDDAYEAVRMHIHEWSHYYPYNCGRIYNDMGALSRLIDAIDLAAFNMCGGVGEAVGSDDNLTDEHVEAAVSDLFDASRHLRMAMEAVNAAHPHVSHLIFEEPIFEYDDE